MSEKNPTRSEHTPGPWMIYRGEDSAIGVGALSDHKMVCRVDAPWTKRPDEEMTANARLIAAAPDLLAALERLNAAADWIELQVLQKDARGYSLAKELEQARAAIAKAQG